MNDIHVGTSLSNQIIDFLSGDILVKSLHHSVNYDINIDEGFVHFKNERFQTFFDYVHIH